MLQAKVAAVALAALAVGSHPAPKQYYLALGDSIAYGLQPGTVDLRPSKVHGYVDRFAARLRQLAPKLRVVNYGCPGETTRTYVGGGCPWLAGGRKLHDGHPGSQQDAALAFLHAHRGQVSPITLTLGVNDINETADVCHGKFACIKRRAPAAIAQIEARLGRILDRLRASAPGAQIVVTGVFNFNVDDLKRTDPLFRALQDAMARQTRRVDGRFADTFRVFNPQGSVERERARICAYTFICTDADPHPTGVGYRAIADAVWRASGY